MVSSKTVVEYSRNVIKATLKTYKIAKPLLRGYAHTYKKLRISLESKDYQKIRKLSKDLLRIMEKEDSSYMGKLKLRIETTPRTLSYIQKAYSGKLTAPQMNRVNQLSELLYSLKPLIQYMIRLREDLRKTIESIDEKNAEQMISDLNNLMRQGDVASRKVESYMMNRKQVILRITNEINEILSKTKWQTANTAIYVSSVAFVVVAITCAFFAGHSPDLMKNNLTALTSLVPVLGTLQSKLALLIKQVV